MTRTWIPERTPERPTVLVDVDGPLAAFDQAALDTIFAITGRRYALDDIRTWEVFESVEQDNPEVKKQVYDRMKGRGGCLGIPVADGAKEGLAKLQELCEVVIVTSPFWGSETWVYEREKWLVENLGIKAHDIIHARKKFHVAGDVLVDDKPDHIQKWSARFPRGRGILWGTYGNRGVVGLSRVTSWDEVLQLSLQV
jgi:5'(3')-deoxyribonucleotidase